MPLITPNSGSLNKLCVFCVTQPVTIKGRNKNSIYKAFALRENCNKKIGAIHANIPNCHSCPTNINEMQPANKAI